MKRYTLSECQHLLAVTNRQLDKLLLIASIDKQLLADASNDKRQKTLSQAQLDALIQLQKDETLPAAGAALVTRVTALEKEVKRLADLLTVRSVTPRISPSVRQVTTGTVAVRHAGRMAVAHGANSQDAARHWSIWGQKDNLIDEVTTLRAIRDYLNTHMSGTWSTCNDDQCSCSTL